VGSLAVALASLLTDVAKRSDGRGSGGAARARHRGRLDVPDASASGERAGDYLLWVDDHVEVVCNGDAAPGCNEGLRFDGLLAVARAHDGRVEILLAEDVVDVASGRTVVGPDPGFIAEVLQADDPFSGKMVTGRQQDSDGVVEEAQYVDAVARPDGLEVVLEDDRHVERAAAELGERPPRLTRSSMMTSPGCWAPRAMATSAER
jgi:hypothetical protein